MKTEPRDIQDDKLAAIGIGAMIVFIALILVAAVAAAVIIQTAEKLQQNAETTGKDTAKNLAGKLVLNAGFVAPDATQLGYVGADSYMFFAPLAPGSSPVMLNSITYQMFCDDGKIEGIFGAAGTADIQEMDAADTTVVIGDTAELQPQQPYIVWIRAVIAGTDCSADNGDASIDLHIHVGTGGSTQSVINIDSTASGAGVV